MIYESIAWVIGAVVTGILYLILLGGHSLEPSLRPLRPHGARAWIRSALLVAWLAYLPWCIIAGAMDGDEGMIIPAFGCIPLLLAAMTAKDAC